MMKKERGKRGKKRQEKEFDQRLLDLARVTRVVRGGRRFRFRATLAIGNRKGKVGIGIAKGADVSDAISKAFNQAKKDLVEIKIYEGTILHEIRAKYKSARVMLKPARKGHGIVVGGAVRQVVELAGINDLSAKILGRGSKVTNAIAALKGLSMVKAPKRRAGVKNEAKASAKSGEKKIAPETEKTAETPAKKEK